MRLGLHVNNPGREDLVRRYVDAVRPSVVKFLHGAGGPDIMDYCRAHGAKVVLRRVLGDNELKPGATGARVLRDRMLPMAREYRNHIDYVEAANEEMQGRDDRREIDRLAELMLGFCQLLDDELGGQVKGCVFNFSVGQPEIDVWARPAVRAALDYAGRHGHAIGMHEYYKPRPWHGVEGGRDGPLGTARGWWMLRLVRHLEAWRTLGLATLPRIIVTESGRDDIPGTPGTGKGWRDEPRTPDGDFADFMAWYCRHLSAIPQVLGVVDFGFATSQPEKWGSFDMARDIAMFERVMATQADLPGGAPTLPPPPPVEDPVSNALSAALAAALGGRYQDDRARLPRHASLQYGTQAPSRWTGIAVHHSAGPRDQQVEAVAAYHVGTNGWPGIGYHFVIRQGRVHYVGGIDTVRAHVWGRNNDLLGICVLGNYSDVDPEPTDMTALRDLVRVLDDALDRALPIDGHGALSLPGHGTACPGRLAPLARAIRPTSGAVDEAGLRAAGAAAQVLQLNPDAALQRRILADGFIATSPEFDWRDPSGDYVAQRAEHQGTGEVRVYHVVRGRWAEVGWIRG